MAETWRTIEGTGGHYEISSLGNLRSFFNGKHRPIRQYINSAGYMTATFPVDGVKKRRQVHRLVAFAFLEPDPERTLINHKDGNKTNNVLLNLEWCNHSENARHATGMGVKYGRPHHEKKVIRSDGKTFPSISAAARAIGVPYSYVRDVCLGRQKTCRGYSFKTAETKGGDE